MIAEQIDSGASVNGRIIALGGSVSLIDNYVVVPEPSSAALLLAGVMTLLATNRRRLNEPL